MSFLNFTRKELFEQLAIGREVEFSLNGLSLFIGRTYEDIPYLYDETNSTMLYSGDLEGLFAFRFSNGESLNSHIESFDFEYLL